MTNPETLPGEPSTNRWRSRNGTALVLRVLAFAVPLVAGYLAGSVAAGQMDPPTTPAGVAGWWVVVIVTASVAAHIAERFTRRLIPLSALLRLTLVFPDRAPSRFRVALQAGNITQLRKRLNEAAATGDRNLAEAAELILALSAALSKHDRRTRGHSERTRAYTDLLAEELGISPDERDKLRWAALLHDVGKLEVPAEILNKPGRLDEDEWHAIRQHPIAGMKLIAPIAGWLGPWALTIEHHHERWNGEGYPHGLSGDDIALGARIVAVADAYDVMISGRTYQARMTHSRARIEVALHAGTQFDPRVVRALINVALGRLRWSTGPLAALADLPLLRPLEALGRDVATVLTAGLVTVTAGSGVLLPFSDLAFADWLQPLPAHHASAASAIPPEALGAGGAASAPASQSTLPPLAASETTLGPSTSTTPEAASSTTLTTTTTTRPPATTSTSASTTTTTTSVTTTTASSAPVPVDDAAATRPSDRINIPVLLNDGGSLDQSSLAIVNPPAAGTAVVGGGGKIRYAAPDDFIGVTTFTYQVCNAQGECSTATVSVTVS